MKPSSHIVIMAAGGAGCVVMEKLAHAHPGSSDGRTLIAINTESNRFWDERFSKGLHPVHSYYMPMQVSIWADVRHDIKHTHTVQQYLKSNPAWLAHLASAKAIILVAGLGGFTGGTCLPVIAQMASHRHIPVVAVVSSPAVWVGERTLRRARRAKNQLQRTVNALTVISCNQISNAHGEYTQDDLYEHVNRLMREAIEKWVKGFWRLKYF